MKQIMKAIYEFLVSVGQSRARNIRNNPYLAHWY